MASITVTGHLYVEVDISDLLHCSLSEYIADNYTLCDVDDLEVHE